MRSLQDFRRYLLDRLVLRPTRGLVDAGGKRRVVLNSSRGTIECFVDSHDSENEFSEVLVLKFPGTAGRAERSSSFPLAEDSADPMGISARGEVWTWNPPGYGSSSGRATLKNIAETSLEFARLVQQRRVGPSTRVFVCGNSLGCAAALYLASQGSLLPEGRSGLILRNPPPLVPVVTSIASRYPLGKLVAPVAASLVDSMDAAKTAAKVPLPIVFLQSQNDSLVPVEMQQLVIDAHSGPQRLVQLAGLDHDEVPEPEHAPLIRDALDWLWSQTCDQH